MAFVPLAPVGDAGLVAATIARAVGLEVGDEKAASALSAYLRPQRMLLLLDNVEHLPGASLERFGAVRRFLERKAWRCP